MIENHVCSLEFSKKLKKLSVKQFSIFSWIYDYKNEIWEVWQDGIENFKETDENYEPAENINSAFTSTELLELLPKDIMINNTEYFINLLIGLDDFTIYYDAVNDNINFIFSNKNLCNALAEMLICLMENKVIEFKDKQ